MTVHSNSSKATASSNTTPPETREPIAIVGIGAMFPKAVNHAAFWRNIREGVDAISETPDSHWQPEDYYDADPSKPDKTCPLLPRSMFCLRRFSDSGRISQRSGENESDVARPRATNSPMACSI